VLPTFIIIGAQKGGTTSLWSYLRSHPQVFVSADKEPGFFVDEINWSKGVTWYEGLFAGAGEATAIGEASTYYTMFPYFDGVPERMASLLPGVKIIYIMRHPVERMRSGYVQLLEAGQERRPIREALLLDARYGDLSSYCMQIERYFRTFDESQILLLTTEELHDERHATMARVCRFLDVDETAIPDTSKEYNIGEQKRAHLAFGVATSRVATNERLPASVRKRLIPILSTRLASRPITDTETHIDDDLRRRLEGRLRPEMERLSKYMGPSFTGWGLLD
jgi:hypothetical protein